tara:strand:+ start:11386 stop:13188 length:1803 start_codon:yes stop_codon:yes gene_type:complete
MSTVANILADFTKPDKTASEDHVDIVTFVESTWGLNVKMWPAQKWILKMLYGIPLSPKRQRVTIDGKTYRGIPVHDRFMMDLKYELSEVEFLEYLYNEGRCNVKEQDLNHNFTEMLLCVGRRGSKSAMTAMIVTYEIYKMLNRYNPHEYFQMLNAGMISLSIVATSSKQAAGLYKTVRQFISNSRFFDKYIARDTEEVMSFRTQANIDKDGPLCGGTVEMLFRPAIGRGLRGPANLMCIFDEFAHFVEEGQQSAYECYEAATPSTATFKNPTTKEPEGKVVEISSPLNKAGEFYKHFRDGMEGKAPQRLVIQAPSWEINPTIPSKYLHQKYQANPPMFMVEFGAQFSDRLTGWIRRDEHHLQCIDPTLKPKTADFTRTPHFMGIDIGLVRNATAIAICHLEGDKIVLDYIEARQARVYPYEHLEELDFEEIADWIHELSKKFYIWRGSFDQREGLPLKQNLEKRGLKQISMEYSTRDSKSRMFQAFKLLMLDKKLVFFDHPIPEGEEHCEYITELLELQEKRVSKYQIEVEAPNIPGKMDDRSDALARAIWQAQENIGNAKLSKVSKKSKRSKRTSYQYSELAKRRRAMRNPAYRTERMK